ncbi:MAG: hypothetical protein ABJC66_02340 [Gammaproteobacteria bacterium]
MYAQHNVFCSRRVGAAVLLAIINIALSMPVDAIAEIAQEIKLPPETAVLRRSDLPGYNIALQKCGICHSADYINLQPPHMTLAQWTAEINKMQHVYGAPIDDAEIGLLGIYITIAYGDATTVKAMSPGA